MLRSENMGYIEREKLKDVLAEVVAEHFKQPFVAERMGDIANASRDGMTARFSRQSLHAYLPVSGSAQNRLSTSSAAEFLRTLESSRPYRRAKRGSSFSVRTASEYTQAWSVFSGLSLGQISSISVLALPVFADDISHPDYYDFGGAYGPTKSLFYECRQVERELCQLSGFSEAFASVRQRNTENESELDPLAILIEVFRRRIPIVRLFEQIALALEINGLDFDMMLGLAEEGNFSFIPTCAESLGFNPNEAFHASELAGNDSNGHVKVSSPFSTKSFQQ
jgi:cell division control protein 24